MAGPLRATLVVMGPSGVGKSSVARALAAATGWPFVEGDDLHPRANRDKMTAGHPLLDEDRWPWLRRIAEWIGEREAAREGGVVTCSALKRSYRDLLREGHPSVRFVHPVAPNAVIAERIGARRGHFMPAALLESQLRILEPLQADEPGVDVDALDAPAAVARAALRELGVEPLPRP
jgi:gluconokinase